MDLLLAVSADLSTCLSPGSVARADTGAYGVRSLNLAAWKLHCLKDSFAHFVDPP